MTQGSDSQGPEACQRLEAVLHLVIGSDLDEPELEQARAHLAQCAACAQLARRARRARQVYFEQASLEGAEAPDLWPRLAAELSSAGLTKRAPALPSDGADRELPALRVPAEAAAGAGPVAPRGETIEARAPVRSPAPGVGPSAPRPNRAWRLAGLGLLSSGLAAAALLYAAGLLGPRPGPGQSPKGRAASGGLVQVDPSSLPSTPSTPTPGSIPEVAAAEPEAAIPAGGLRPIPASERLRLAEQGFEFLQPMPGLDTRGSGRETLVNLSYPR